ncbi:MAG TPA: thioredoxin domain-containing protein [Geminicoccaceae bacterium]|nr:thioredoxin domain-containing protein [Geminicoccaceae bacterium]
MADPRNRLGEATSPYLLQHRENPVHWQPWDEVALAEARNSDRPILLSVGYAACHWCHVMAHESFENPAIAALMNEHFINIKVDREERPDLDQLYQHALALLGQHGGWPLTMFLTPAGEPFWGGTYFPPESRYGRPGFPEVLETVARIWRDDRERVTSNTTALKDALGRLATPARPQDLSPAFVTETAQRLIEAFDTIHGGFAGAPKFPQAPLLHLLWRQALASNDQAIRQAVLHTLVNMCQGGIYDTLGGGFARYSVDALWLVPHFEKMLYDNAQLIALLSDAWADTQNPLFAARVLETIGWLEREMLVKDAFASSLDADSEGEEGKFYVWDAVEIDRLLGPEARAFRLAYGVTDAGNWEGKTILNRLHQLTLGTPEQEAALRSSADVLLAAREKRVRPGRDDKVLTDWNGLTIVALARASAVFGRPAWLARAAAAFTFVCRNMMSGDRLAHSWRAGRRLELAFLEDYAQMAAAALALFEHTANPEYLERAIEWVGRLDADYLDPAGGYYQVAAAATDVLVRPKNAQDGPTPAANGTLVGVLARLHALTGKEQYRTRAEQVLAAFSGEARRNPAVHAALLSAYGLLADPLQVVVIGDPDDRDLAALRLAALGAPWPDPIVLTVSPGAELAADHPAAGKSQIDARATAYVCPGRTCLPPVTAAGELAEILKPAHLRRARS